MTSLEKTLARFDYRFPPELIAQAPASPRDSARLLVHRRRGGGESFVRFRDLPEFLPPGAVLVFNQTKVIPARLELRKETGGKVLVLYVATGRDGRIKVMADRRLEVGRRLSLDGRHQFLIAGHEEKFYFLKPLFPPARFDALLDRHGRAPLPPYIKRSPLTESQIKEQYQAVFARRRGSVAAPTASLHFTAGLLRRLKARGFDVRFVTLHVNLGTFAPLTEENLRTGRLHEERYEIDPATAKFLNAAKTAGRPIVAVGTTVVRTLESAIDARGRLRRLSGTTDLFIRGRRRFRFVDGLITNFHVPRSSLMMLVAAFAGRAELLRLYDLAIKKRFRLFSFGDGMLII